MARKFSPIVALALVFAIFYEPDNFDPESMAGKRVLITGASSGIGEELAYAYSRLGASVLLTARRADLLEQVAAKCKELGAQRAEHVPADMSRPEDRERVVVEVEKRLGGLDQLILNHAASKRGVWSGSAANMSNLRFELEVNFISFVDVASRCLPMLKESHGRLGVVSSITGKMSIPLYASYTAEKHALQGFFSALRQELYQSGSDVTVSLFALGMVETKAARKSFDKVPRLVAMSPTPATAADTAVVIMKGVTKGAYEVRYPKFSRLVVALHNIAPGYVEDYFASLMMDQSTSTN